MKDEIPQLSGPWGTAFFNELDQPVFRYAPPLPLDRASAGMPSVAIHRFGNASLANLVAGDGRFLPIVSTGGRLVSLCGDPFRPAPVSGNRLFIVEGGLVRPVVGPDHPHCDRSDVVCAPIFLSANSAELDVTTPDLAVRCRVSAPLEGTPTLLLWMQVSNHSQGTRWVTLWNLWRLAPVILEAQFLEKAPLTRRLAAALGIGTRERVDNSYFALAAEGGGARVQVSTEWDSKQVEDRWKGVRPVGVPPIQVVALTRNIELTASGIPQPLQATLAAEPGPEHTDQSTALVAVRAAFEVRSREHQVAAVAIHLGQWDQAKTGLKRLLPLPMHVENEAIVARKRFSFSMERVRHGQREIDRWQGAWQAGITGALGLKDVSGGLGTSVPPLGSLLRTERRRTARDQAVTSLSLAFNHAALCGPLLAGLAADAVESIEAFHGLQGRHGLLVDDLAWTLWALAESDAILGWSRTKQPPVDLAAVLSSAVSFLGLKELRGPHGLLTTAWCDPSDKPHVGPRGAAREAGNVETLAGSAMTIVACLAASQQFSAVVPEACGELERLSVLLRSSIDSVAGSDGILPCWLFGQTAIGSGELRPVQIAWLLLDPDCPTRIRESAGEAVRRMVLGGRGGVLESFVDPDPSAPRGPADLVENAVLVAALARSEPALAAALLESFQPDALLRDRPGEWSSVFLPGPTLQPMGPPKPRSGESPSEAWGAALMAADGRGCAAVHLARCLLAGVTGLSGGFEMRIDLFDRLSLRSPVLSVLRTDNRIHGLWQGAAAERTIRLTSAVPGEIGRWRIFKGTPAPASGANQDIVFHVQSGESWGIELA